MTTTNTKSNNTFPGLTPTSAANVKQVTDNNIGREGSLILERAINQSIVITLKPDIDRNQPISHLIGEGLELKLLDVQSNEKFGESAVLGIFGSDAFYVRRDGLVKCMVDKNMSPNVINVDDWQATNDYEADLVKLRRQYTDLTNVLRKQHTLLSDLLGRGAKHKNNSQHIRYRTTMEEKNECIRQRDLVEMRIKNIETTHYSAFKNYGGSYQTRHMERMLLALKNEVGNVRFKQIEKIVDKKKTKSKIDFWFAEKLQKIKDIGQYMGGVIKVQATMKTY